LGLFRIAAGGLRVVVAAASATTVRPKADTTDVADRMYVVSGFSRTAQIPFDQAIRDLSSADPETRLHAVRLRKVAASRLAP
jgi:hypothetical protein